MLDPGALFTTNAITRRGIAQNLNDQLNRKEFAPDDDRLSDEFCRKYASALGEIDWLDIGEEGYHQAVTELHEGYFGEFGLEPTDD